MRGIDASETSALSGAPGLSKAAPGTQRELVQRLTTLDDHRYDEE